jgi:hypothetical protein
MSNVISNGCLLPKGGLVSSLGSVVSSSVSNALVKLLVPIELDGRFVGSFLVILSSVSCGSRFGRILLKSAVVAMWVHWALLSSDCPFVGVSLVRFEGLLLDRGNAFG